MAGVNPVLMISRQSAAGNDGVDMIMGQQVGTPRVQDGEEPDLRTEASGSVATSSRVWELASNRRSSNRLRDVSAKGFSSWGRVKTTWK
jgi:hypothetical protein